jgi:NADH-quinone oxidoreductase subunit L
MEPVIARVEQAPAQTEAAHATAQAAAQHATAEPASLSGLELGLMLVSLAVAGLGIYLGIQFYGKRPELPKQWAARLKPLYRLSFNKWYWDWLLDVKGVQAGKAVNNALWRVDAGVVDGGVNGTGWLTRISALVSGWWDKWIVDGLVNATGWITRAGSVVFRTAQTGLWQNYALLFVVGLFLVFVWYVYPAITTTLKGFIGK